MKKTLLLSILSLALAVSTSAAQRIVVNLTEQRACAYNGSQKVFCGNISSGKPGHRTPTGHYHVMEKDIDHVSSKYPEPNGGAKMHYMLRVTGGGIAMHLGHVPNYPASHGCIRMQNGFAQRMYRWAHVGTPISIIGSPRGRVSRSSYSRTYGTSRRHRSTRKYRRNSATDALAEFMGVPKRTQSVRKHTRKRRHTKRRHRRRRHHRTH